MQPQNGRIVEQAVRRKAGGQKTDDTGAKKADGAAAS
jgi:hypothetical protein